MAGLGLQHPDGADFFVPDVGQRIDAQGRVTYDFTGHVHAQGLDLDAATSSSPAADRAVRWLKTSNGAVIALLQAYDDGTQQHLLLDAVGTNPTARIEAASADGTRDAVVIADATLSGANVSVIAAGVAPAHYQRRILDDTGASDYALRTETQVLWAGPFNPASANVARSFSVPAPGNYTLQVSVSGVVSTTGFVKLVWSIDGVQVAFPALIFNVINQHMAFPTALGSVFLPAGNHSWSWTQVNDGGPPVTVNAGDSMHVLLIPSG